MNVGYLMGLSRKNLSYLKFLKSEILSPLLNFDLYKAEIAQTSPITCGMQSAAIQRLDDSDKVQTNGVHSLH